MNGRKCASMSSDDTQQNNLAALIAGVASHGEALPAKFKAALDPRRHPPTAGVAVRRTSTPSVARGGVALPMVAEATDGSNFGSLLETAPWAVRNASRHVKPLSVVNSRPLVAAREAGSEPVSEPPRKAIDETQAGDATTPRPSTETTPASLQALLENAPWSRHYHSRHRLADHDPDSERLETARGEMSSRPQLPSLNEFIWRKVLEQTGGAPTKTENPESQAEVDIEGGLNASIAEGRVEANVHAPSEVSSVEEKKTLISSETDQDHVLASQIPPSEARADKDPGRELGLASQTETRSTEDKSTVLPAIPTVSEPQSAPPIPASAVLVEAPPGWIQPNSAKTAPTRPPIGTVMRRDPPPGPKEIPVEDLLNGVFNLVVTGFRSAIPTFINIKKGGKSGIANVRRGVKQLTDKI